MASLLLAFTLLAGCQPQSPAAKRSNSPKLSRNRSHQVTAACYPLGCFAKRLVGDSIEVRTLTPSAESTKPWRPSRAEILSMQESDVIFVNGSAAPFATWLPHVTLPDSKICATANDGLKLSDMIAVEDIRIVHSHGPEGEHSHPTMVTYSWLDPAMAAKQVAIMAERLASIYPELKSSIAIGQQELTAELESLTEIINAFQDDDTPQISVLTDSPNLKFLTRALGLNDIHLNWEQAPGVSEAKTQIKEKIASATPRPKFILFANEPTTELRSLVESFNLSLLVVDSMKYTPIDSDYFCVMIDNLDRFKPVFGADSNTRRPEVTDSE